LILKTRFCFVPVYQQADHRANNNIIMCNIYSQSTLRCYCNFSR